MVAKTDAKLQESLSALMDNEASELELHRLLKALETDPSLAASWSNYHHAASAIRAEASPYPAFDISGSISAAIADEPAYGQGKKSSAIGRLWHTTGRFAVAASVAGAVVIGAQQYVDLQDGYSQMADTSSLGSAAGTVPEGFQTPDLTTRAVSISDAPVLAGRGERTDVVYVPSVAEQEIQNKAIEEHLNQLMLEHAENATQNSAQGLLPYARIAPSVSLERNAPENPEPLPAE
ncbi:sigma-E factor negative regulatory protein [Simiduia curdlanivorans]|uniref:Sigma-E factor negative regulatory protein n=1 Tax=Simiduia curdlanivorans TaxID=1492769 RepID=A0ABV8V7I7_9GAMM|nr:sigma-E factor negative regulatory protein [Simiduia curdlanivorans]MDN3639796.1 sigma-E factor negative regulatory protein [Simiduia curdlanivorans]